ncbi:3-oxoadipate enol-lactonase protein [Halorhabdus tiamatea SARL4B]|uniref:3-oxoadipate enol-lactonase protein n=1 Tax=Halorhabdus tiamatea SARL4B TaxID=1033806 RepID=F7PGG8_9EURY|nr:alpha/beta hydrolase [Halorhabdus tiamatea]ERJ04617.1 3-oxoadipate enol-lactonase protein [Halorhabdus tiamatea SARL4B]CCQ33858.1 3-oxoadipate enol-lactone hydrolase / 4-carboxymuconolactone decarboxylase [Halorhabdus tiamatea SARL4B]
MPTVDRDGVTLRYDVTGSGPTVVFVNDIGFGAWLWSYQHAAVAGPYEAVVWDLRGTGESDTPAGPYALSTLVADLETVVSAVGSRRVHLVGAGLGGAIALEYARRHDRVASLTLLGTAPGAAVDEDALSALAAPTEDPDALRDSLDLAFGPGVPTAHPETIEQIAEWRSTDDAEPARFRDQQAAWLGADLEDLYEITTPALVMSGTDDAVVDPAATARLAEELPRGEHRRVEGGHLFFLSESGAVSDELLAWLEEHTLEK